MVLPSYVRICRIGRMERVVFKAKNFQEADRNDVEQQVRMTPRERWRIARALKDRLHPDAEDVRECHRMN